MARLFSTVAAAAQSYDIISPLKICSGGVTVAGHRCDALTRVNAVMRIVVMRSRDITGERQQ
jgi:hypothetical protein